MGAIRHVPHCTIDALMGGTGTRFKSLNTHLVPGLPHQTILSLLEDRDGFLWIGTSNNLARFDGIETLVYKYDPLDPHGLAGGAVVADMIRKNPDLDEPQREDLAMIRDTAVRMVSPSAKSGPGTCQRGID